MLASPRGFCAGVARAVNIVEAALVKYGAPVFVRHEIVHNQAVVKRLEAEGAVFVESLDDIPMWEQGKKPNVIFSAHGVAPAVIEKARALGFETLDATCPLVSKVHAEVRRHKEQGRHIFLIGHRNHPEIIGTIGHIGKEGWTLIETLAEAKAATSPNAKTAYATQTTLSVSETAEIIAALKKRFSDIATPNGEDICYATTNRQNAVREIAPSVDRFFILGAENSSNAKRLVETAQEAGAKQAQLIARADDIDWDNHTPNSTWGLSAGASTPAFLVEETIEAMRHHFDLALKTLPSVEENIVFRMPAGLR
jgi:4-hydroxy-3-methylbut-2-enyl diphosphate reductase